MDENWNKPLIGSDIENVFTNNNISSKDLELIINIDLSLFKKKSDNEKIVLEKILYLVFVNEAQKYIEIDKNVFLNNLPMFMNGLEDEVIVTKSGKEKKILTQEIIEENLVPIINDLSDEEREKAEKLLNLS